MFRMSWDDGGVCEELQGCDIKLKSHQQRDECELSPVRHAKRRLIAISKCVKPVQEIL